MSDPQRFVILLERLTRVVFNGAHAESLRPVQWEALRYLARANRYSRNPSALTAYIGTTKGTISQTINALERKALLSKSKSSRDARGVSLDVTQAGHDMLELDPTAKLTRAIAQIPAKDLDQISNATQTTLLQLIKQGNGKTFDACHTCRHFLRATRHDLVHHCELLNVNLSDDDSKLICVEQDYPNK